MGSINDDQRPMLWGVNSLFIAIATLGVVGRVAARLLKKLPFGLDDWAICVALAWDWALYGIFTRCAKVGLGKHRDAVGEANVAAFQKLLYFFQLFYILGPPTIKLSLLFLYRRIFTSPKFLRIIYGLGALIAVWLIVSVFLAIFDCVPIHSFWTGGGKCLDFKKFGIGYAIVNIVTDIAVWLLPIPMIWDVQLRVGQKIALSLIFLLGLFDCAAAFTRLMTSMLVLGEYDVMWVYSRAILWSIIEISIGILCTCLPTMRVVFASLFSKKIARALGLSSGGTNLPKSHSRPWMRSTQYSELESSGANVSRSATHDPLSSSHHIQVREDVKVELQPIPPTGKPN
ncbi:hypothetical protein NUU61_004342 [Penicillium alfredii]|uniref:Rhodopsin domain-containing protein n=1 Tax=Penicillium alfredii TaxID=1506179 RepID=A0A9W9KD59_9EURO|nr:uncharacterized protein NUU61_004342 [Penicillium alfredii]KAJ5102120.1 hypothetical protein NUU61_004342 [Penicillium alfredii]